MSKYSEKEAHLGLALTPGVGPLAFLKLKMHFGSAYQAFVARHDELALVLHEGIAYSIERFRASFEPQRVIDTYTQKNISVIAQSDPDYPPLLQEITDPPICLFVLKKNNQEMFSAETPYFAIVGSRRYTSYGKEAVLSIGRDLSSSGLCIVSGLALGIDAFAHESALLMKGKTVAVLGCGVDVSYPPSNNGLREKIIESGNIILSEYPPGTQPSRGTFVARNRIVSGMSRGVLIIEGSERSGTLLTATFAANQGRDVFAVPGQIFSPTSRAPLILLKQGAKLVLNAQDILSEYGLSSVKKDTSEHYMDIREKLVYETIRREPLFADEIAHNTKLSISIVMGYLTTLEIKGVLTKDQEGRYVILS